MSYYDPYSSRFYELSSEYYQIEGDHGEYYRNSLMYLGVTDLSKFDKADRKAKAFSLGISALLATVCLLQKNLSDYAESIRNLTLSLCYTKLINNLRMSITWANYYNTKFLRP